MELAQMIRDKNVVERSNRSISSEIFQWSYTPVEEQQAQVLDVQQNAVKD